MATWTCSWHLKLLGFPRGSTGKESICSMGDLGLIHGLGRSSGEGKGCPLQYSGLEVQGLCSPWGRKESDTTERPSLSLSLKSLSLQNIRILFLSIHLTILLLLLLSHFSRVRLCVTP